MRKIARIAAAAALAIGCASIPLDAALACSCAFPGYREAIATADVAFVGTVVGEKEPGPALGAVGMPMAVYAFAVERSKQPMQSPFEVAATFGGDANCGFDMAIGEAWLVIASVWEGRLETNSCTGTTRVDGLDADTLLVLDAALEANASNVSPEDDGLEVQVPTPVLLAGGTMLVLGLVSLLVFRREPRR
jgi:hypothetical protein